MSGDTPRDADQGIDRSAHQPEWIDAEGDWNEGIDPGYELPVPENVRAWMEAKARDRAEARAGVDQPARDRGIFQVAGNARHLVGRTIIEVKATHRAALEDYIGDVELHFDDGTMATIRGWTEPAYRVHGVDIDIGWWRDELTGKYPWHLGRP